MVVHKIRKQGSWVDMTGGKLTSRLFRIQNAGCLDPDACHMTSTCPTTHNKTERGTQKVAKSGVYTMFQSLCWRFGGKTYSAVFFLWRRTVIQHISSVDLPVTPQRKHMSVEWKHLPFLWKLKLWLMKTVCPFSDRNCDFSNAFCCSVNQFYGWILQVCTLPFDTEII